MKSMKFLVSLVAVFALVLTFSIGVSAQSVIIDRIGINAQYVTGPNHIPTVTAGENMDIEVVFTSNLPDKTTDVVIEAKILGRSGLEVETPEFDVLGKGHTYNRRLSLKAPFDVDFNEEFKLQISIYGRAGNLVTVEVPFVVQADNDLLEILSIENSPEVKAGENMAIDVVLKNRGRHRAEDNYVIARIPDLGISKTVYFRDLSVVDISDPELEDSAERRLYLQIPENAVEGLYTLEIEAYNSETSTLATKKIFVSKAGSQVVSSQNSKSFAAGETKTYTMTIVNTGNSIKVYNLVVDSDSSLNVELADTVVVVPAGSSQTVRFDVSSSEEGTHGFTVNVQSEGQVIDSATFTAEIEGKKFANNAAVLLTVVLAIIFVVLLIVLIVLLTRKPETKEELGESYY